MEEKNQDVNNAMVATIANDAEKEQFNKEFEKSTGIRVVETEEGAREVLNELQTEIDKQLAMDPKERKLEQYKQAKEAFDKLDKYYKSLDRRGRRKFQAKVNPALKFSNQIKKVLKSDDLKKLAEKRAQAAAKGAPEAE
jgi:phosphoglycerate-specific signal transduction histidine kinase